MSNATTGAPVAAASSATMPNVSNRDGSATSRATPAARTSPGPATQPTNRVRLAMPSSSASARSDCSSGPVPAITKVPGIRSQARAHA